MHVHSITIERGNSGWKKIQLSFSFFFPLMTFSHIFADDIMTTDSSDSNRRILFI